MYKCILFCFVSMLVPEFFALQKIEPMAANQDLAKLVNLQEVPQLLVIPQPPPGEPRGYSIVYTFRRFPAPCHTTTPSWGTQRLQYSIHLQEVPQLLVIPQPPPGEPRWYSIVYTFRRFPSSLSYHNPLLGNLDGIVQCTPSGGSPAPCHTTTPSWGTQMVQYSVHLQEVPQLLVIPQPPPREPIRLQYGVHLQEVPSSVSYQSPLLGNLNHFEYLDALGKTHIKTVVLLVVGPLRF